MKLKRATPPFPPALEPRAELSGVSSRWMRKHFGEPHFHDADLDAVLSETDFWAWQLPDGGTVVLGLVVEHGLLLLECDTGEATDRIKELGLERFAWAPVERL